MSDDSLSRSRESLQRSLSADPTVPEEQPREVASGDYREFLARWEEAQLRGEAVTAAELSSGLSMDELTAAELMRLVEGARAGLTPAFPGAGGAAAAARLPHVPGYELLEVLGRGGMGVVYKARQLGFNRVVALKRLRAGAGAGPDELARFRTEAEAIARLRHPNIVQVHDIGESDDCPYFSMEHLEGGTLAKRAKAEPLAPRRAAELIETLARAMQHVHDAGVVHRDLKPSNVLLDADGTPKVADFGLAKLIDADATQTEGEARLGTACYMPPEQAVRGQPIGPAADVYGLGAILYELLTGRPPVERATWEVMLPQILAQDPPDPSGLRPGVSRDLEAVCLKCLRKDPSRRYASAQGLADDLRRWLDGKPTAARPLSRAGRLWRFARRRPLIAAAVLLLLIAAVIVPAAIPVASHYRDPERVPKNLVARVDRGQAATLIGPAGRPAWSRLLMGQPEVMETSPEDGTFIISSLDRACVELLHATPTRGYRFHVELRHLIGHTAGLIGIYFAHERFRTSKGTEHCFCAFTFNDRQIVRGVAGKPRENGAELEMWRVSADDSTFRPVPSVRVVKRFRPAADEPLTERPWRVLEVVVTGDGVEVYWNGELVGRANRSDMVDRFRAGANNPDNPDEAKYFEPGLTPSFGPGGGLGLLVQGGQVSVKNVFVGPASEAKADE